LISDLADQIRITAAAETPAWAAQLHALVPAELIADIQVWRAATEIDPRDLRPTGPTQPAYAKEIFQKQLDIQLATHSHANVGWQQLLTTEIPRVTADPFLPQLAERLSNLTAAGFNTTLLLRSAAAEGPLPDDHPAAALWWRILDQLPPPTSNRDAATPSTVAASRRTTTTSPNQQRRVPR
jgi:hypothetical protein